MGKNSSVIDINGNHYDAITGQLLGAVNKLGNQVKSPVNGPVIDGFMRQPARTTAKKIKYSAQHVHQRAERSKTLMRNIVTKPKSNQEQRNGAKASKARADVTTSAHMAKAMYVVKNTNVKHFGRPISKKSVAGFKKHRPAIKGEILNQKPAPAAAMNVKPMPSMITSVSHQRLERMLDEALIKADTHKQALKGKLSNKRRPWQRLNFLPTWAVVSLTVLVIILAAGFFAWRNIPQVSMKLASMRTQVKATVPAYTPSGYKFVGPIKYDNSSVTLTYKSGETGQSFSVTQQTSNWDSSSLEANTMSPSSQVQTSQVKGTTVYIYNANNDATWVNNGVRYTIKDKAKLNSDQLLKIADSLQ